MAYFARVFVTPRNEVLDPQGKAVERALHGMGFEEVQQTRVGRYLELVVEGDDEAEATRRLTEMCERLLANPVVEDYRFEVGPT
jgi:phosphoribosylformylglycinamidine synthase